jgi:hypothetical protein
MNRQHRSRGLTLKRSGLVLFTIGLILITFSKFDKRTIEKGTLNLSDDLEKNELITPVRSELRIKLNGKREQNGRLLLYKNLIVQTAFGQRLNAVPPQERVIKKGNDKFAFDLERDTRYYLAVRIEPFIPFTIDYKIVEYNSHQDQLFNLGVALTATGLGIAFS